MRNSTARVQQHRQITRDKGFRVIQLRVRDTRSETFKAECKRQSLSLKDDAQEKEMTDWIESVADVDGWVS